jgi:hypothetical protein
LLSHRGFSFPGLLPYFLDLGIALPEELGFDAIGKLGYPSLIPRLDLDEFLLRDSPVAGKAKAAGGVVKTVLRDGPASPGHARLDRIGGHPWLPGFFAQGWAFYPTSFSPSRLFVQPCVNYPIVSDEPGSVSSREGLARLVSKRPRKKG